ncbi:hypothetical protein CsSME_00024083 [Camellia sinensis var. sinensis]
MAEFWAIRDGLKLALDNNVMNLDVETDGPEECGGVGLVQSSVNGSNRGWWYRRNNKSRLAVVVAGVDGDGIMVMIMVKHSNYTPTLTSVALSSIAANSSQGRGNGRDRR